MIEEGEERKGGAALLGDQREQTDADAARRLWYF